MIDVMQLAAQIGGVGGLLAVLIFLIYRIDRKSSEKRIHDVHKAHCERMDEIINRDQESREKNTVAFTELLTFLKIQNGKTRRR